MARKTKIIIGVAVVVVLLVIVVLANGDAAKDGLNQGLQGN